MARILCICLLLLASGAGAAGLREPAPLEAWGPIGEIPTMLAPGFINTGLLTRDVALSPDGRELFFSQATTGYGLACILVTRHENGAWTPPEVASFSGLPGVQDLEPAFHPDGRRLFFFSSRPRRAEGPAAQDIWMVERKQDGWGPPRNLGAPVNTADAEFFPSLTQDGTLYFCRRPADGRRHDIWRSRLVGGEYQEPEKLPTTVNSGTSQFNACISADGRRLIVPVAGHPENRGGVDYWLCRRQDDDSWSGPFNLGPLVNDAAGGSWSPALSPDGRYFFFMSSRRLGPAPAWPRSWSDLQAGLRNPGSGGSQIWVMRADFLATLPRPEEDWPRPAAEPAVQAGSAGDKLWAATPGRWFGNEEPGPQPAIFAPGQVSTGLQERDLLISPDGSLLVHGLMDQGLVCNLVSRWDGQAWSEPRTAPWHTDPDFACFEPTFSADGGTVLFLSNRAAPGQEQGRGWSNQNIFRSRRLVDGSWSPAEALPAPVTSDAAEYYPSLAADGTLYFSREDSTGQAALWSAEPLGEGYAPPQRLPDAVNCGPNVYNGFVSPDESLIIACVAGHPENLGPADYWVSFRTASGAWGPARNLGPAINGEDTRASSAWLDRYGRFLFFSSTRKTAPEPGDGQRLTRSDLHRAHWEPGHGSSDIWWVDAAVLDRLR